MLGRHQGNFYIYLGLHCQHVPQYHEYPERHCRCGAGVVWYRLGNRLDICKDVFHKHLDKYSDVLLQYTDQHQNVLL